MSTPVYSTNNQWKHEHNGEGEPPCKPTARLPREDPTSFTPTHFSARRLNNVVAQKISREERDSSTASRDHTAKENGVSATKPKASPLNQTYGVRGAGPELSDATGFHLVNVFVHAATCSSTVWLFRAVFAGESNDTLTVQNLPWFQRTLF